MPSYLFFGGPLDGQVVKIERDDLYINAPVEHHDVSAEGPSMVDVMERQKPVVYERRYIVMDDGVGKVIYITTDRLAEALDRSRPLVIDGQTQRLWA